MLLVFGFHGDANKSSAPPYTDEPEENRCVPAVVQDCLAYLVWMFSANQSPPQAFSPTLPMCVLCMCVCLYIHTMEEQEVLEGGGGVFVFSGNEFHFTRQALPPLAPLLTCENINPNYLFI